MKVVEVVANAGHGKTWTLDAIKQKAEAEGKLVFQHYLDVGGHRGMDLLVKGVGYQISQLQEGLVSVLILDDVPRDQVYEVIRDLRSHVPNLTYLVLGVRA